MLLQAQRKQAKGVIRYNTLSAAELSAAKAAQDFGDNYRGEVVWAYKQHIKIKDICGQLATKESYLEAVFVKTINALIKIATK